MTSQVKRHNKVKIYKHIKRDVCCDEIFSINHNDEPCHVGKCGNQGFNERLCETSQTVAGQRYNAGTSGCSILWHFMVLGLQSF